MATILGEVARYREACAILAEDESAGELAPYLVEASKPRSPWRWDVTKRFVSRLGHELVCFYPLTPVATTVEMALATKRDSSGQSTRLSLLLWGSAALPVVLAGTSTKGASLQRSLSNGAATTAVGAFQQRARDILSSIVRSDSGGSVARAASPAQQPQQRDALAAGEPPNHRTFRGLDETIRYMGWNVRGVGAAGAPRSTRVKGALTAACRDAALDLVGISEVSHYGSDPATRLPAISFVAPLGYEAFLFPRPETHLSRGAPETRGGGVCIFANTDTCASPCVSEAMSALGPEGHYGAIGAVECVARGVRTMFIALYLPPVSSNHFKASKAAIKRVLPPLLQRARDVRALVVVAGDINWDPPSAGPDAPPPAQPVPPSHLLPCDHVSTTSRPMDLKSNTGAAFAELCRANGLTVLTGLKAAAAATYITRPHKHLRVLDHQATLDAQADLFTIAGTSSECRRGRGFDALASLLVSDHVPTYGEADIKRCRQPGSGLDCPGVLARPAPPTTENEIRAALREGRPLRLMLPPGCPQLNYAAPSVCSILEAQLRTVCAKMKVSAQVGAPAKASLADVFADSARLATANGAAMDALEVDFFTALYLAHFNAGKELLVTHQGRLHVVTAPPSEVESWADYSACTCDACTAAHDFLRDNQATASVEATSASCTHAPAGARTCSSSAWRACSSAATYAASPPSPTVRGASACGTSLRSSTTRRASLTRPRLPSMTQLCALSWARRWTPHRRATRQSQALSSSLTRCRMRDRRQARLVSPLDLPGWLLQPPPEADVRAMLQDGISHRASPGLLGIPPAALLAFGNLPLRMLTTMMRHAWYGRSSPILRACKVAIIGKPGKASYDVAKSFRNIAAVSVVPKVVGHAVARRKW